MNKWEGKKGPPLNLAWGPRGLNPALPSMSVQIDSMSSFILSIHRSLGLPLFLFP